VYFIVEPDRDQLATIAHLVDSGRLTPVVDRVMPLADAQAAYEGLPAGHRRGKVVLHVTG
jgi:NADPH:quinone reductase-like Zn-dependent oxidoreductase